jgi:hypothetical protein
VRSLTVRAAALVAAGALLTHQGRYLVGYGERSEATLAQTGHGYLPLLVAVTTAALGMAAAGVALALLRARRGQGAEPALPAFAALWPLASTAIALLYLVQEGLEVALTSGHAAGLAGIVGQGGWTAFAFAAALGAVVAVLLRGTSTVVALAGRSRRRLRSPRPVGRRWTSRPADGPRLGPVPLHLAGRGPPPRSA